MADNMIALPAALESEEALDLTRQILSDALARLMDLEVSARCRAGHLERTPERENSRNGYRGRGYETRMGHVDLKIPKLRKGTYFPSFLEPRKIVEKALVAVIQEAYLQGVSTRAVDDLVQALGGTGISKSEVSRLVQEVGERVAEFLERRLESEFPYVWLDATYSKVREGGRIVSKAAVVAVGLSKEGRREILGMRIGHAETEEFWTEFLLSLLTRGLRGVQLVTSDCHAGLRNAIAKKLACQWQRCRVHFMRNLLARVPKGQKEMVAASVRTAFAQRTAQDASKQWRLVADGLRNAHGDVSRLMDEAEADVLAHRAYPSGLWPMLASNNGLERLNRELKRRCDVVQIFPKDDSLRLLAGAILMEQHDEWQVARRQVSRELMGEAPTRDDALLARGAGG